MTWKRSQYDWNLSFTKCYFFPNILYSRSHSNKRGRIQFYDKNTVKINEYFLSNKYQRNRSCSVTFLFLWKLNAQVQFTNHFRHWLTLQYNVKSNTAIIFFPTAVKFTYNFSSFPSSSDTNKLFNLFHSISYYVELIIYIFIWVFCRI